MRVEEKRKIKEAIELLMSDEGFNDGIDILCSLVGLERAASKAMVSPSAKTVSVFGILANSEAVEHTLAPDGFPPSHRDDPFCECSFCMGFVSRKPAAGKA